jgi:hypothetical protein
MVLVNDQTVFSFQPDIAPKYGNNDALKEDSDAWISWNEMAIFHMKTLLWYGKVGCAFRVWLIGCC